MTGARPRVDARRPLLYVVVAAVLALVASIVTGVLTGPADRPPPPAPPVAAPAPPPPACTDVQQSLRPLGPLPPPGRMPAGSTMARIAANGRLKAGVDQGKYRAGFRNPSTGKLEGSDIDVVRAIAAAIFGDPERVQYVVLNIADRATAVESGQVDLVANSFTVNCARQRQVAFSTPYATATQRLLVPRAAKVTQIEDLAGKTVCTSAGSTTQDVLATYPVRVQTLPGIPDCVVEMQAGRVQAVSSDDFILAGLAAQDPQTVVVGRPLATADYAVAMSRSAPDLVRFVNGVLERGRADGSLAASDRRWFAGYLDPVPQPPPPRYRD